MLEQGTRQIANIPAEQIDATLLELAKLLLGARSTDADPPVTLVVGPMVEVPVVGGDAAAEPHHNAD